MTGENRQANVAADVARGQESLESAELLLAAQKHADAVARAYYAIHHFARALLLTRDVEVRSHQGLRAQLGLHFVRTGRLDARFAKLLVQVQRFREVADYESTFTFTHEHAEEEVRAAREFVAAARSLLATDGFLPLSA
ncbi:MAG: HEPN domain-containing protein [Deltaproteobacteria bacterium]|nr:HEPN domain-containing protein [Deltaproteobacteria bacterium]